MKIWFIERNSGIGDYDAYWGHIVEAPSPKRARQMVAEHPGDEGPDVWLDTNKVTVKLIGEGKSDAPCIWLSDYNAG
jgi:hypothetical protein